VACRLDIFCHWTRDMAINPKAKSIHCPSTSDQSENFSFSWDSKKPQTLPGTAYLFQARVQVYFNSSEPFLATPVAEVVMLYSICGMAVWLSPTRWRITLYKSCTVCIQLEVCHVLRGEKLEGMSANCVCLQFWQLGHPACTHVQCRCITIS